MLAIERIGNAMTRLSIHSYKEKLLILPEWKEPD
jgi:hypothetical protein